MQFFKYLAPIMTTLLIAGCSSDGGGLNKAEEEEPTSSASTAHPKVDYTKGRTMNARLGKGINLGNAWDGNSYWGCGTLSEGDDFVYTINGVEKKITLTSSDRSFFGNLPLERYNFTCNDGLDGGWGNPIKDEYFTLIKQAGFNSVRIPVRWQHNSDPVTHAVNPERLAGVLEDVQLAINAGLAVVVSFHWYYEIMFAANKANTYPDLYEFEKEHYASIWGQVASAFEAANIPDDMIVYDLLNEPTFTSAERMNEVLLTGYNAIRAVAPGKTIMFESKQSAKFAEISSLEMPADGNIIYSGHYYEPYGFTHQGHSYACQGDAAYSMTAANDFKTYVASIKKLYPDSVSGLYIPVNMGEFGVSGGAYANTSSCADGTTPPSDAMKAKWAKGAIAAAEAYGMSWHYWGFVGVGGFEAYDKKNNVWLEGFPAAFGL